MADGRHFEKKPLNRHISATVWPILMKFLARWRTIAPYSASTIKILNFWNPRPGKYTTRVDPTSIIPTNFEVDITIHCRVIAFLSAHTSRDLDFWPFDHEQLTCMAGHVTNLATKFEHPMPIRSWFMSYNVSLWLPLKMRTGTAHAPNHVTRE